jgi:transposase
MLRETYSIMLIQLDITDINGIIWRYSLDSRTERAAYIGIITFTYMASSETNPKHQSLQGTGTFNPRAAQVKHPLFQQSEFFDPHDLLQLKYEAVRAIEVERYPIAQAARQFGLSRPTLYQAQWQFQEQGLAGLLPHQRGPQKPHKLTPEVRQFLLAQKTSEPHLGALELAHRVRQRFQVSLHPRTIEKAWPSQAKRGRRQ